MAKDRIVVEDVVDGAIIAGFQLGSRAFLESVEDQLRTAVVIQESGDAQNLLQMMIDESENMKVSEMSAEKLEELGSKLSKIL
jgi:hypothetical protein